MALVFNALIPEPGAVDPSDLADALDLLAGLAGAAGAPVPTVAAAATTPIFAAPAALVAITGTAAISAFDAHDAGARRWLRFQSAGTSLNHSGAIACPGASSVTVEAGTLALVVGDGTSTRVWQVWHPSSLVSVGAALPPGFIFGLGLANNALDPANDIDIATGKARDGADGANLVLASALTKRLDATWAVGTNQGGLDTGSKANSTTYHLWLIGDSTTVDVLFSTSATAPAMPGGYTLRRRIGAVLTDGSGAIRAFQQQGDEYLLATPPLDVATTIGASRTLQALTVPAGVAVEARIRVSTNSAQAILVQPVFEADAAPSGTATPLFTVYQSQAATMDVRTNTSRQVALRATAAATACYLVTRGWIDRRGRDA